MPTMEFTAKVIISLEDGNLGSLEAQIDSQLRQIGKQVLTEACQKAEQQVLAEKGKAVKRQRLETRQVLTRFGWIELEHYRVKEPDGSSRCPLDEKLGLEPWEHVTPWVKERAIYFVTQLPYRPAAQVFSAEVGEEIDHRTLWRLAQKEGHKLVAKEEEAWKAVFEDGELPEGEERE